MRSEQCTREVNFGLDEFHRPVLAVHLLETALPPRLRCPSLISGSRRATLLLAAFVGGTVAITTWIGLGRDVFSLRSPTDRAVDQPTIRSVIELHPDARLAVGGSPPISGGLSTRPGAHTTLAETVSVFWSCAESTSQSGPSCILCRTGLRNSSGSCPGKLSRIRQRLRAQATL